MPYCVCVYIHILNYRSMLTVYRSFSTSEVILRYWNTITYILHLEKETVILIYCFKNNGIKGNIK